MSEAHWRVFVLIVKIHIYIQSTVMRRKMNWNECSLTKAISDVNLWMVCSLLPAVIGNILNVQGGSLCGHRCYILYLWFGLWFLMYKRVQWVEIRVILWWNYPLEFVSYSVWRRRIGRKGRNPKKCQGGFLRAWAFTLGRMISICLCTARTLYSLVPFADASLCSQNASSGYPLLRYTNKHHQP